MSTGISMDRVDQIIDSYGCQRHHLIAIMQDIQAEYKYLSPEVLERIAEKLDVGVAKVYSVATAIPGIAMGKVTLKKVRIGPAPTSRAASSCCRCTLRNALEGSHTINIMELIIWIIITPGYVPIRPYL